jgi:dihydrofolate synthase/folylpolyglutamate synthase
MTSREYLLSLEQFGIKLGLEQIRALLAALGRPDLTFPSIVVAGTNGKGSVTAMVERGLRSAGYRTGRYTSPHLTTIEERIAVDGRSIAPEVFDRLADRVQGAADRLPAPPSFFEATTALALEAFREAGIDLAVVEVGLGGRLDATNVLSPMGVAITSIDFDHEQYLGHTITAIAAEKAGVIKPGTFCVLAANPPVVRDLIEGACRTVGAGFVSAPDAVAVTAEVASGRTRLHLRTPSTDYGAVTLSLRGRHQIDNAVTAVRLLEELAGRDLARVPAGAIRSALEDVEWPGRLELRPWQGRDVLIDGAHNPAGARALAAYLQETYGRRLPIVVGAMRDKSLRRMIEAMSPSASCFICTAPQSPRSAPARELAGIAREVAPSLEVIEATPAAAALQCAIARDSPVVVAGSLYLAGEIRAELS